MAHRRALLLLVAAFAALTAASHLGHLHWLPELLSHFRVQWTGIGLVVVGLCAASRLRVPCALAVGLLLLHAVPALTYAFAPSFPDALPPAAPAAPPAAPEGPRLRVALANVNARNRDREAVIGWLRETSPDLVGLLEIDPGWARALEALADAYPYRVVEAREGNFGLALFSRLPLDDVAVRPLVVERVPMITAGLRLGATPVTVAVAHPVPPRSARGTALRDRQLAALASLREREAGRELLLLADLNASPWSPAYRALEARAGLVNAARGRGWLPTWPTFLPPLGIPIDHCLVSPGLAVRTFAVGRENGSDHRPILAEVVPAAPGQELAASR